MRLLRDDSSQKSFNPQKAEKNTENNNTEYSNIEKNIIENKHTSNIMTLKTWATKNNRFGVISSQVSFKVSTLKNPEKSTEYLNIEKNIIENKNTSKIMTLKTLATKVTVLVLTYYLQWSQSWEKYRKL